MEQGVWKMTNPNTAPFQEKSFKISIYSICIVGFTPKMGRNPNALEKNVSSFQVVINLKIFGQGWSVALTALKHSTFSATVLKPCRWRDVFRGFVFYKPGANAPQYAPLSRWLLGKMKVMGTLWKFIMNSGCSWWMPWATFWGAWSSSAWSCFVLWGDKETENNGVKMSVYTMFHHISLHEVVQLVVSAHLEKDWLIGSSSQVRVNMSNHSFEIWCL